MLLARCSSGLPSQPSMMQSLLHSAVMSVMTLSVVIPETDLHEVGKLKIHEKAANILHGLLVILLRVASYFTCFYE
ncbi:unnamed protein product [Ilex paraguariensis]|uniref:Uncharacterized protein n=1 Tax=Ilex paraguariensis TaxID=185542 RepID=A0ABC8THL8_9AQUA